MNEEFSCLLNERVYIIVMLDNMKQRANECWMGWESESCDDKKFIMESLTLARYVEGRRRLIKISVEQANKMNFQNFPHFSHLLWWIRTMDGLSCLLSLQPHNTPKQQQQIQFKRAQLILECFMQKKFCSNKKNMD